VLPRAANIQAEFLELNFWSETIEFGAAYPVARDFLFCHVIALLLPRGGW
jgi:hypothetical protein